MADAGDGAGEAVHGHGAADPTLEDRLPLGDDEGLDLREGKGTEMGSLHRRGGGGFRARGEERKGSSSP